MHISALWIIGALLLPAAGPAAAAGLPPRETLAITDVAVVDLEHGGPAARRTVLVQDGRIAAVTAPRQAQIPAQARRVDGRGKFLIPGLVDMHVHLFNGYSRRPPNDWAFPLLLANGVTAVREMNAGPADLAQVRRWREALQDGSLAAPRILAAGVAVQGSSAAEMLQQLAVAAEAGADFIKVFSTLPGSRWPALHAAAEQRGLRVAGHTPATLPLLETAAAGLASNEHLMQLPEACSPLESSVLQARREQAEPLDAAASDAEEARLLQAFDERRCRQVAAALSATSQVQVPTLVLAYHESRRSSAPHHEDPRRRYLRSDEDARWDRLLANPPDAATRMLAQRRWTVLRRITGLLHQAGVPMLVGTDAPMPEVYPGFALQEELALLVAAGLRPHQALHAATLGPAEFLGIADSAGSVQAGKHADLLLLDADPLRNIRHTRRIHAVVLDGRLLERRDLDALLESAAP